MQVCLYFLFCITSSWRFIAQVVQQADEEGVLSPMQVECCFRCSYLSRLKEHSFFIIIIIFCPLYVRLMWTYPQVFGILGNSSSLPFHAVSQYVRTRLSASQNDLHRVYSDCCSVTNSIDLFIAQQSRERRKEIESSDGSSIDKTSHQQSKATSGQEGMATASVAVMERRKWSDIRRNLLDAANDHESFYAVSE